MSVIDGPAHTVTATVPVGNGPGAVAVDPNTHTVYVTHGSFDGTVSVIDGSAHTVTATVPVGKLPLGVAVDPGTHTVYVTNEEDDTVSVIDGSAHTSPRPCPSASPRTGWRWIRAATPSTSATASTTRCR